MPPHPKGRSLHEPLRPRIHPHVPRLLANPDWTPGTKAIDNDDKDNGKDKHKDKDNDKEKDKENDDDDDDEAQETANHSEHNPFLQVVWPGEGKSRMVPSNLTTSIVDGGNTMRGSCRPICIHFPILVRDTPESIGMKLPRGARSKGRNPPNNRKKTPATMNASAKQKEQQQQQQQRPEQSASPTKTKTRTKIKTTGPQFAPFSISDVAEAVGLATPVQMIDCATQKLASECEDWTLGHLLEYLQDEERQAITKASLPSLKQQRSSLSSSSSSSSSSPFLSLLSSSKQATPSLSWSWLPEPESESLSQSEAASQSQSLPQSQSQSATPPPSAPPPPALGGRKRRKAALASEEKIASILHNETTSDGTAASSSLAPNSRKRNKNGNKSRKKQVVVQDFGVAAAFRTTVLNQISYEFSGTPLHDMVRSPGLVRAIDWIDHAWPSRARALAALSHAPEGADSTSTTSESRKNRSDTTHPSEDQSSPEKARKASAECEYPVVQYYCLTSASGAYTDFHIDFGGSSVWYHVVSGSKVFCVLPPTDANLAAFREWLCMEDQSSVFFPDRLGHGAEERAPNRNRNRSRRSTSRPPNSVELASGDWNSRAGGPAVRFCVAAGETLILPAGWIHAVYTPGDSLVFGGNFMHGWDMGMQLSINKLEADCGVLDRYRFPHFGALQMYAAGMYLRRLKDEREGVVAVATDDKEQTATTSAATATATATAREPVSDRELDELPFLLEELRAWWALEARNRCRNDDRDDEEEDPNHQQQLATDPESLGQRRNRDMVASRTSFRTAARRVIEEAGCRSIPVFLASLRKENNRARKKRAAAAKAKANPNPNANPHPNVNGNANANANANADITANRARSASAEKNRSSASKRQQRAMPSPSRKLPRSQNRGSPGIPDDEGDLGTRRRDPGLPRRTS